MKACFSAPETAELEMTCRILSPVPGLCGDRRFTDREYTDAEGPRRGFRDTGGVVEPTDRSERRPSALGAFKHRDFRWLWGGSFLSFVGSWVQSVAQGWLVFEITGDEAKLAFVTFCGMAPVSVLGLFAGALVDSMNRKAVLVFAQSVFAACALFLAAATHFGFVTYEMILAIALIQGVVSCAEMPARQSIVGTVVPPEELAAAVPINAMTFNLARVLGPAIGGILLAAFGPQACYLINGISYTALISAVLAIRADVRGSGRRAQPIKDLVFEGMTYTMRDPRLRLLFLSEAATSSFGIFYIALMPAIAKEMLGLDARGLGGAMTAVGVGSIAGLVTLLLLSHRPLKGRIVRLAMAGLAVALVGLGMGAPVWLAFVLLALAGLSTISQFNTTNTLFQLLSPDRLRGRVLAMHIWAISGVAPFGTLAFGWIAREVSLRAALMAGGTLVGIGAVYGWARRKTLENL